MAHRLTRPYDPPARTRRRRTRQEGHTAMNTIPTADERENADESETRMPVKRDALWAVSAVAHPAIPDYRGHCEDCMNLTNEAIDIARATGSRGATAETRTPGGETHSATVARVIRTVTR